MKILVFGDLWDFFGGARWLGVCDSNIFGA